MAHRDAWDLGIDEVSGLGRRRNPTSGRTELLAVGDRDTIIATIPADESGRLPRGDGHQKVAGRFPVRGLPDDLASAEQSDWEGVAGDADGRVVVLRETGSTVLVVSPTFDYERSFTLRWEGSGDGSLESLLLLADGHLLSATQVKPLRLLEFAPPGDRPLAPLAVLPADRPWRVPSGSELRCVASWEIPTDDVRSVNDLAAHGDHLFVISSASRRIARFRMPSPGSDGLDPDGVKKLPKKIADGRHEKAEGLLVDGRFGILVGVDRPPHARGADVYELGHAWKG